MVLGEETMTKNQTTSDTVDGTLTWTCETWIFGSGNRQDFRIPIRTCFVAIVSMVVTSLITNTAHGQFGFRQVNPPQAIDREEADKTELKTDPELEAFLEKAERFKQDGNYRVATQLLQSVLERSGDSLYSDDGQLYFSLVRQVESILAKLPAEGIAAYRINADAEAKSILAAGREAAANGADEIGSLNQVVNQFFNSSVGDDAAFRLGTIYLDRYDFIGAARMFEKALLHPDTSIPAAAVHIRIALCKLFLNDAESAEQALQKATEADPSVRGANSISEALDNLQSGRLLLSPDTNQSSSGWTMPLGNSERYGMAAEVDLSLLGDKMVSAMQYYYPPLTRYRKRVDTEGVILAGKNAYGKAVEKTLSSQESKLQEAWIKNTWRPNGTLLFDEYRVYFKTAREVVALELAQLPLNGNANIVTKPDPTTIAWRSVWANNFAIDGATAVRQKMDHQLNGRRNKRNSKQAVPPASVSEVQFFGDAIAAQMSIVDRVLYSIEGKIDDSVAGGASGRTGRIQAGGGVIWGQGFTRQRFNHLVAYDLDRDGYVKWQVPRQLDAAAKRQLQLTPEEADANEDDNQEESPFLSDGGFMAAPIGYRQTLIAPVNRSGSIWVYALDPADQGKTLWKVYLCEEPSTGAAAWSPINLSIDGSDLFVSCGLGVLFVLDPSSGAVRFAKRYERGGKSDPLFARGGWSRPYRKIFNGWSSDTIVPYGRQLIRLSSDADSIQSIDRETGKLLWDRDLSPVSERFDYLLGVRDGVLYAGGKETVVALDLKSGGRILWGGDPMFDGEQSLGRGMLTEQGVFVPAGEKILLFSLDQPKSISAPEPSQTINVDLGGFPVGNLFSDGQRIWVHGGNRIYALNPKL